MPDAEYAGHSIVYLRASASRTDADGTFANLQAQGLFVQVAAITADTTTITADKTSHTADEG